MDLYIKPIGIYIKYIGNGWEWLGNGWEISNLCAPLRGIPGRGLFFRQKSSPFLKRCLFGCFYDKTSVFFSWYQLYLFCANGLSK